MLVVKITMKDLTNRKSRIKTTWNLWNERL